MAKRAIEDTTLSALANAARAVTGRTDKMTLAQMTESLNAAAQKETWTITLTDGSVVEKKVVAIC